MKAHLYISVSPISCMAYDYKITVVKGVTSAIIVGVAAVGGFLLSANDVCNNKELMGAVTVLGSSLLVMANNWRKHHADPSMA